MINKERVLNEFMQLARIESTSLNEKKLANYLYSYFSNLGYFVCEDIKSKTKIKDATTGNLIVKIPGKGKLKNSRSIMFSAHMDTVSPAKNVSPKITNDGKYITSDGTTILGADDKAGIVQLMELANILKTCKVDHSPIELVFTVCEEIGCFGSFNIDTSLVESKICYVIDGDGGPGAAIIGGPDYYEISGEIQGKSSHAGISPELGISSIKVLSEIICKIPLLKVDDFSTANVGKVICDSETNVVPYKSTFAMEVRSIQENRAQNLVDSIYKIFSEVCKKYGAKFVFDTVKSLDRYKYDIDHEIIQRYVKVCNKRGYKFKPQVVRGGTDNSGFIKNNIDAICLSSAGLFPHELHEKLDIEELYKDIEQLFWLAVELN